MNHEYKTRCHTTREWLAYQHKQRTEFLNKIRKARRWNTTDGRLRSARLTSSAS